MRIFGVWILFSSPLTPCAYFPLMVASARSRTVPQGDRCKFAQKPEAIWSIKNIPGDISTGKSKKVGWVCKCWGSWQHQEPRESFAKDSIHHRCPWISPLRKKRHIHTTTPHQRSTLRNSLYSYPVTKYNPFYSPFPTKKLFFFRDIFWRGTPIYSFCAHAPLTVDQWKHPSTMGKPFLVQ